MAACHRRAHKMPMRQAGRLSQAMPRCTHAHTHTHTHSHAHAHTRTHTHAHAHARTRTRARTSACRYVTDIAALAEIAHAAGVPLIIDNTVATPYLCRFGPRQCRRRRTAAHGRRCATRGTHAVKGGGAGWPIDPARISNTALDPIISTVISDLSARLFREPVPLFRPVGSTCAGP